MPDMRAVRKRHVLLVCKGCEPCEPAKKDFATRHFGYGEIVDIESPEGRKLLKEVLRKDPDAAFTPQELELEWSQRP